MKKQKLLIVGCGDIGTRLARQQKQVQVRGLARTAESANRLRSHGITPVAGDLDRRTSLGRLSNLSPWVLHLGPPPGDSAGDPRTRRLIAALAKGGSLPRRMVYISTSGVYGNCNGERVFETRPLAAKNARAKRRVDAERQLRRFAAFHGIQLRTVCLLSASKNRHPLCGRKRTATPIISMRTIWQKSSGWPCSVVVPTAFIMRWMAAQRKWAITSTWWPTISGCPARREFHGPQPSRCCLLPCCHF
jgi:hypothetical protein